MKIRKITSLTATLSFLLLILNSVVLYITPHGRIARWTDWRLWGLTKTEWTNQHVIIGILFLLALILHIYYNWKSIVSYLKNKARQLKIFTRDFNIALVLTVVCTVGAYIEVPPFNWVLDFSESIKNSAEESDGKLPYGRAELSTLKTFTAKTGLDLTRSVELLKKANITFKSEKQTLQEVARLNKISPQQVYIAMKPEDPPTHSQVNDGRAVKSGEADNTSAPTGLGKLTLTEAIDKYKIDMAKALEKLAAKGINAKSGDKMRKIAEESGMTPSALFQIIK